jgi:rhodanese-related sulfurtransferase
MLRVLVALVLLAPTVACAEGPSSPSASSQVRVSFSTVDVRELKRLSDSAELVVLDVRTDREFAAGHMPGAINIDVGVLDRSLEQLIPFRDQPIYVSCRTSNRSRVASQILVDAGFTDVTQVLGGFSDWESSGYPVER